MRMRISATSSVIRELRIVSCPGGGVWVAVTREFERDNCVTSEILQSDWTIPNRAGVPRKSTKVPRPSFVQESREGLGPRLLFSRILCVSNHVTHAYAHAHFSNERVMANCSCLGGGVAVTRDFERDICVTSEILQSDWTLPNRAPVPRKSSQTSGPRPRPSFVRESREGLGPRLASSKASLVTSRPTPSGRDVW